MTTPDLHHRRPLPCPGRIAAAFGGAVLVAATVAVAGAGVAAAESVADILTRECTSYEPNPDLYWSPPRVSDCHGANLAGANLNGANLAWANLTGVNLSGASLTDADLSGASLTDADLNGTTLTDTNLAHTTLTDVNLSGADLSGADLSGANLNGANLNGANLNGANLTGTSAVPADIIVVTETVDGASVTWSAPTMPAGLTFGACASASAAVSPGDVFPVGSTAVTCTVTSVWGGNVSTGSGTFTVTVTVAPVIDPPVTGSLGSLNSIFGFGS